MKTPGQLLAELLKSSDSDRKSKKKELEEASKRVLESYAPPGTVITVCVEGFTGATE